MEAGWIKIYTSSDFFKSELVRQVLTDHEIDAILLNKQGFPYRLGEVEVYIHEDHFQKALEIIIKNEL
ncbi:MAG: putative signal transducing protein [Daejeonella sp.]